MENKKSENTDFLDGIQDETSEVNEVSTDLDLESTGEETMEVTDGKETKEEPVKGPPVPMGDNPKDIDESKEDLEAYISELEEMNKDKDMEIMQLKQKVGNIPDNEVDNQSAQMINELSNQNDNLKNEVAELKNININLSKKIEELESKKETRFKGKEELERIIKEKSEKINILENRNKRLRSTGAPEGMGRG